MDERVGVRITESDVETYTRDGVVCLRRIFGRDSLELLSRGIDRDIADPGPLHTLQQLASEPGFFLTDFCMAQRIAEIRQFVVDSPAAQVAARIMRSQRANFFYDGLWAKDRGTRKRTRWHQDQPYYPVDGDQLCVLWIPLDPITSDVCLELIRGSHRWNRWFQPELTRDAAFLYGDGAGFEQMPDIEATRADYDIVSFDMEPGDCIAFHGLVVHGAPGNDRPDHRRRALSLLWLGDDAVFATRPGPVRPLFEGHGLQVGDPMDCPHFPRLHPAPPAGEVLDGPRFGDPGFRVSIFRDGRQFTLHGGAN